MYEHRTTASAPACAQLRLQAPPLNQAKSQNAQARQAMAHAQFQARSSHLVPPSKRESMPIKLHQHTKQAEQAVQGRSSGALTATSYTMCIPSSRAERPNTCRAAAGG